MVALCVCVFLVTPIIWSLKLLVAKIQRETNQQYHTSIKKKRYNLNLITKEPKKIIVTVEIPWLDKPLSLIIQNTQETEISNLTDTSNK
jgi:hypothetical protein